MTVCHIEGLAAQGMAGVCGIWPSNPSRRARPLAVGTIRVAASVTTLIFSLSHARAVRFVVSFTAEGDLNGVTAITPAAYAWILDFAAASTGKKRFRGKNSVG